VQGVVTDISQAVVPGAHVVLVNDETGITATRQTDVAGRYVFDFVEPGSYTLTIEFTGVSRFVQKNVGVQVRGDVTVDGVLRPSAAAESVTVTSPPIAVQFNTSTTELTIDRKQLSETPILARNPFSLALLDTAVVNRYGQARNPYYMYSSEQIDVGGPTSGQNELLLDGAPLGLGNKGSYAPPMDAVQEFSVQQNSMDAEFGHTAGGVLSVSMKSGTNQVHGTAYYFGRNPNLNAVSNSLNHTPNIVRNHIGGATAGGPILKNKLFTFAVFEKWHTADPKNISAPGPTRTCTPTAPTGLRFRCSGSFPTASTWTPLTASIIFSRTIPRT
jgi:hypothetical protein